MEDFSKFSMTYRFKAELVNAYPLSVGGGETTPFSGIDNPVIRMNGKPYIPGSSIKGVLRCEAERYAKLKGLLVCDVVGDPYFEKERADRGEPPCIICQIFGGPTIASHVIIPNAMAVHFRTETRTCVSISRITGGQHPGRLYTIEYITPNARFSWEPIVYGYDIVNGCGDTVEIINYLFRKFVTQGMWIGGRKSIGHGLVKMIIKDVFCESITDGELKIEKCTDKYLARLGVQ